MVSMGAALTETLLIKNPCHFKCGKFTVRAQFAENGVSLEDCLKQVLI